MHEGCGQDSDTAYGKAHAVLYQLQDHHAEHNNSHIAQVNSAFTGL